MLARGDRPRHPPAPDERAASAQRRDAVADLIVLCHACGVEWRVVRTGEDAQHRPVDRAGDPGARHRRTDRAANDNILAVRFGELIEIMSADPARGGVDQRHHGQLDHREARQMRVEHVEFARVDDILGVVEDDRLESQSRRRLMGHRRAQ